jgi:hypothetical protein
MTNNNNQTIPSNRSNKITRLVCCLPSLINLADPFKGFMSKSFREVIRSLMQRVNLENHNFSITDCIPEEMPLDKVILCVMGNTVVCSQQVSSIVVLEDPCMNGGNKWLPSEVQLLVPLPSRVSRSAKG